VRDTIWPAVRLVVMRPSMSGVSTVPELVALSPRTRWTKSGT
jgi:hypothetical protein